MGLLELGMGSRFDWLRGDIDKRIFTYAKHREAIGDGFKIRISTHANDRQEIDFAPIAGNNISSFHVQGERRGNRLISLMVRCRYRT